MVANEAVEAVVCHVYCLDMVSVVMEEACIAVVEAAVVFRKEEAVFDLDEVESVDLEVDNVESEKDRPFSMEVDVRIDNRVDNLVHMNNRLEESN